MVQNKDSDRDHPVGLAHRHFVFGGIRVYGVYSTSVSYTSSPLSDCRIRYAKRGAAPYLHIYIGDI